MTTTRSSTVSSSRIRVARVPALVLAGGLLSACALLPDQPSTTESAAVAEERAKRETLEKRYRTLETQHQSRDQAFRQMEKDYQKLEETLKKQATDYQKLEETLKKQATAAQSFEEQAVGLNLLYLEKDAQVKLLGQKLDAAIQEVVRALAKLRSLESKAEAASTLAEAEIALKLLERESAGREKDPDIAQAQQLLKLGGDEFRKENYGGALYLTGQAKALIKGGQARSTTGERLPKVDGETLFSLPFPLRVQAKATVREGPSSTRKVAFVAEEGALVIALSYKGLWVRVRSDDGRSGWIAYNLVGQR